MKMKTGTIVTSNNNSSALHNTCCSDVDAASGTSASTRTSCIDDLQRRQQWLLCMRSSFVIVSVDTRMISDSTSNSTCTSHIYDTTFNQSIYYNQVEQIAMKHCNKITGSSINKKLCSTNTSFVSGKLRTLIGIVFSTITELLNGQRSPMLHRCRNSRLNEPINFITVTSRILLFTMLMFHDSSIYTHNNNSNGKYNTHRTHYVNGIVLSRYSSTTNNRSKIEQTKRFLDDSQSSTLSSSLVGTNTTAIEQDQRSIYDKGVTTTTTTSIIGSATNTDDIPELDSKDDDQTSTTTDKKKDDDDDVPNDDDKKGGSEDTTATSAPAIIVNKTTTTSVVESILEMVEKTTHTKNTTAQRLSNICNESVIQFFVYATDSKDECEGLYKAYEDTCTTNRKQQQHQQQALKEKPEQEHPKETQHGVRQDNEHRTKNSEQPNKNKSRNSAKQQHPSTMHLLAKSSGSIGSGKEMMTNNINHKNKNNKKSSQENNDNLKHIDTSNEGKNDKKSTSTPWWLSWLLSDSTRRQRTRILSSTTGSTNNSLSNVDDTPGRMHSFSEKMFSFSGTTLTNNTNRINDDDDYDFSNNYSMSLFVFNPVHDDYEQQQQRQRELGFFFHNRDNNDKKSTSSSSSSNSNNDNDYNLFHLLDDNMTTALLYESITEHEAVRTKICCDALLESYRDVCTNGGSSSVNDELFSITHHATTNEADEKSTKDVQYFILIVVMALCGIIKNLIRYYELYWLPEAGGCILVGVLCGIASIFIPHTREISFNGNWFLRIMVPPIIFEAALSIDKRSFVRHIIPIVLFATVGTICATILTALIVHYGTVLLSPQYCTVIPFVEALTFGSLISSIDPIAVLSVLSSLGMTDTDTIYVLIFGESLLNDGVAIVLFDSLVGFLNETMIIDHVAITQAAIDFVYIAIGSIVVGTGAGCIGTFYFWLFHDCQTPLVEMLLFFCWALLPYYVCDGLGLSGIVGTVAVGFCMDLFIVGDVPVVHVQHHHHHSPSTNETTNNTNVPNNHNLHRLIRSSTTNSSIGEDEYATDDDSYISSTNENTTSISSRNPRQQQLNQYNQWNTNNSNNNNPSTNGITIISNGYTSRSIATNTTATTTSVNPKHTTTAAARRRAYRRTKRCTRPIFHRRGHLSKEARTHINFVVEIVATGMETAIFAYLGFFLFSNRYHWNVYHVCIAIISCCLSRGIMIPTLSTVSNCLTRIQLHNSSSSSTSSTTTATYLALGRQDRIITTTTINNSLHDINDNADNINDDDDDGSAKNKIGRTKSNNIIGNNVLIDRKMQIAVWFSGLRGAMSFALVEYIPMYDSSTGNGTRFKPELKAMTSASIMFTMFVLGGSTYWMMQTLGITPSSSTTTTGAATTAALSSSSQQQQRKTIGIEPKKKTKVQQHGYYNDENDDDDHHDNKDFEMTALLSSS